MYLSTPQILALKSLPGIGSQTILKIINLNGNLFGDEPSTKTLLDCLKFCKVKIRQRNSQIRQDIELDMLENSITKARLILERNLEKGISTISYFDDLFPQTLKETRDETGKKMEPPFILFYKGDIKTLKMPCLTMIGTRENTPIAKKAGEYLAEKFAQRNFCIVSGLAIGCDASAHVGALNAGGKTLAFMGHGLDTVYPPQNARLADEIVSNGGLLMSEYGAGTPLSRYSLVARDRLQAGISLATIVIQTGVNGGTMHAANATLNSAKPLYVLRFRDRETACHEKTQGNYLLEKKGALTIRGEDNLDEISAAILQRQKSANTVSQPQLTAYVKAVEVPKNLIFDLDLTLVDTSMLEELRNARKWQEVYKRISETLLYQGMEVVFEKIRQTGAHMAIVTSSPRPYVERLIKYHNIPCDYIIDYHTTKRHKPDPEPMLHALKILDTERANVISFGDRAIDIKASNSAGISSVACFWGTNEPDALRQSEPTYSINNVADILNLI